MEVEVSPAMLVPFYETTLHNNAEDANVCSLMLITSELISLNCKYPVHVITPYVSGLQTHFVICSSVEVQLLSLLMPLLYRVSQEEWTKLRESVPYVKIY